MEKVFGALLLAAGILIAGTSGMCMLAIVGEPGSLDLASIGIVLLIGGVPFGIGVGLGYLGYRLVTPRGTN